MPCLAASKFLRLVRVTVGFAQPIFGERAANLTVVYQQTIGTGQSYLPVRAGLVIRKANQLSSLLALHLACGVGYEYSKWVSQRNNFW